MADRSSTAIASAIIGIAVYITFILITWRFNRRPALRGRALVMLLALIHLLLFRVIYESCVRVEYCVVELDTFRVWAIVTTVHLVVAWAICLHNLTVFIEDLIAQIKVERMENAGLRKDIDDLKAYIEKTEEGSGHG